MKLTNVSAYFQYKYNEPLAQLNRKKKVIKKESPTDTLHISEEARALQKENK